MEKMKRICARQREKPREMERRLADVTCASARDCLTVDAACVQRFGLRLNFQDPSSMLFVTDVSLVTRRHFATFGTRYVFIEKFIERN